MLARSRNDCDGLSPLMEWRSSRWFVRIYNGKSAKVELSACGFDVTGCESAIRLIDETMSEMAIFHQLTFCHQ
jgi:hypothetical protein